ncbi:MAG: tRNA (adenosine(37)-N6)-threonylcarbamoyltransferase complex dimerization subunit type 1 TsaB [Gemmataceae bacterium]
MTDRHLLALIDTSTRTGMVGLSHGNSLIAQRVMDPHRGHARDLSRKLRDLLNEAGLDVWELSAIGINIGPGSFTGIRVALATVKALACTIGARLVAVDTFDLIFQRGSRFGISFRAIVDFQLNGWLTMDFERDEAGIYTRRDVRAIAAKDTERLAASDLPLCGPGLEKLQRAHPDAPRLTDAPWEPRLEDLLAQSLRRVDTGQLADPYSIEPLYTTVSSAEQIWDSRQSASE